MRSGPRINAQAHAGIRARVAGLKPLPARWHFELPPCGPRPLSLTLQVHLQPHALGLRVLFDDVVHLFHIAPHPRVPAIVLIKELGEIALQLQPQLALLIHRG